MTDIKVLSRDEVEILGSKWTRSYIQSRIESCTLPLDLIILLGWREILRMMDEFEEPAPKWEPGTVLINREGWKYRLDKLIGANDPEMWEYTNMQSGRTSPGLFYPFAYKIHRLPHEFRVGDWAQWIGHRPEPFQVNRVQEVDGRLMLYGLGAFLPAEECSHAPALKREPKPTWEPGTVVKQITFGSLFRMDEFIGMCGSSEEWKFTRFENGVRSEGTFDPLNYKVHRLPTEFLRGDWVQRASDPPFKVARTGATSPAGTYWVFSDDVPRRQELNKALVHVPAPKEEKPENPFTGPHWDEVARDANRDDALAGTLCIKDLRDELNKMAGRKKL